MENLINATLKDADIPLILRFIIVLIVFYLCAFTAYVYKSLKRIDSKSSDIKNDLEFELEDRECKFTFSDECRRMMKKQGSEIDGVASKARDLETTTAELKNKIDRLESTVKRIQKVTKII